MIWYDLIWYDMVWYRYRYRYSSRNSDYDAICMVGYSYKWLSASSARRCFIEFARSGNLGTKIDWIWVNVGRMWVICEQKWAHLNETWKSLSEFEWIWTNVEWLCSRFIQKHSMLFKCRSGSIIFIQNTFNFHSKSLELIQTSFKFTRCSLRFG